MSFKPDSKASSEGAPPPAVACAACSSEQLALLLTDGPRSVFRCKGCQLAFLSPFPTEAEFAEMYSGSFYARDAVYAQNLRAELSGPLRRRLPSGRVLDVGAGAGEFVELATRAGYQAEGIDTSAAAVNLCRQSGLTATQVDLREHRVADGTYDCITMWDVIEHLVEPRAYLEAAHRLLRPGGLLVIKTPDVEWAVMGLARILAKAMPVRGVLGYPPHILYFNTPSLTRLLEGAGFVIDEARHIGSIRTAKPRRLTARAYRVVLESLERLGLAGNLLVYARKPMESGRAVP